YRTVARRDKAISAAASAARARHCHSEWISAQPRARVTSGESQLFSLAMLVSLIRIQNAAEFFDFLCRGPVARKGVHHQLAGGAFKHALQHVPGKLALGLLGRA